MTHRFGDDPFQRQLQLSELAPRDDVDRSGDQPRRELRRAALRVAAREDSVMTISSDLWDEFAPAPPGTHPPLDFPGYTSTGCATRAGRRCGSTRPRPTPPTSPARSSGRVTSGRRTATSPIGPGGEAVGQRIIVTGRLLDSGGRPIPSSLVEIWQANASGRYRHVNDQWPGHARPQLHRRRAHAHRRRRRATASPRSAPAPTRGATTPTRGAPPTSTSRCSVASFTQRLVTQMYFPDDPLFFQDPMLESIADPAVRARLVARYDHDVTEPSWALGFRFDIVLRGPARTPLDTDHDG